MGNKSARKYSTPEEVRRKANYREWERPRDGIDVQRWLGSSITIGSNKGI